MTSKESTILAYLPNQQKIKLVTLLKRFEQQSQQKMKFSHLYNQLKDDFTCLKEKYDKLKQQNQYLKKQMHAYYQVVYTTKAHFQANKQKRLASQDQNRNHQEQEEWTDDDRDQTEEENRNSSNNQTKYNLQQTIKNKKIKNLEQYRPPITSSKKNQNFLNNTTLDLNQTNLSQSKRQEKQQLKKQIRQLQQQKRKRQQNEKKFSQKYRLVDEIKNRYKNSNRGDSKDSSQRIDISDTFNDTSNDLKFLKNQKSPYKINDNKQLSKRMDADLNKKEKQINQLSSKKTKIDYKSSHSKANIVTSDDLSDLMEIINYYN